MTHDARCTQQDTDANTTHKGPMGATRLHPNVAANLRMVQNIIAVRKGAGELGQDDMHGTGAQPPQEAAVATTKEGRCEYMLLTEPWRTH